MVNFVDRIHAVFNNHTLRSVFQKIRYPIFIVVFILLIQKIEPAWFLPGILVSLFGELIQFWSFASLDKNKTLSVQGPYTLTRNPMYLGRFFLLLGCVVLTSSIWLILAFCVLYYFYVVSRVKREESKLRPLFGANYETYCHKVNRFIPSFRELDLGSLWFFKWKLLFQNHGHWNMLAVLCCYATFYYFTFIRANR